MGALYQPTNPWNLDGEDKDNPILRAAIADLVDPEAIGAASAEETAADRQAAELARVATEAALASAIAAATTAENAAATAAVAAAFDAAEAVAVAVSMQRVAAETARAAAEAAAAGLSVVVASATDLPALQSTPALRADVTGGSGAGTYSRATAGAEVPFTLLTTVTTFGLDARTALLEETVELYETTAEVGGLVVANEYGQIVFDSSKVLTEDTATGMVVESYVTTAEYGSLVIVDGAARIIADTGTTPTDHPDDPDEPAAEMEVSPTYDLYRLRQLRHGLSRLASGGPNQVRIALVGDSWTDNEAYWGNRLAKRLMAAYGDGGVGWFGFGSATGSPLQASKSVRDLSVANFDLATVHVSGTHAWVMSRFDAPAPDGSLIVSSQVGDQIVITLGLPQAAATLFYEGGAASVRWRLGSGSWTTLDLAGSGILTAALGAVPAGTLTFEVVSGEVRLCGVVPSNEDSVRVDKLGVAGSNVGHWTGMGAAWADSMAELDPHCVVVLFGTNDQNNDTAGVFASRLTTLVDRLRASIPRVDILLSTPPENDLGRWRPMTDYAIAARSVAVEKGVAYLDLQPYFGELADYRWGALAWLGEDGAHPSHESTGGDGGALIVDTFWRAFTSSI